MAVFTFVLLNRGNIQIWIFSLLLVVGAAGTLMFGPRRLQALGRIAIASAVVVALSLLADLALEAIDPGFGYWLYFSLYLVPGILVWAVFVALASPEPRTT